VKRVSSNFYFLCLQHDIASNRMNIGRNDRFGKMRLVK
jgi:hypothetical protein